MDFFNVLTLIGGICLFLFGINVMGQALERRAGSGLRSILGKLTSNRFAGLLTGAGVTAAVQSSTTTTVMVVGFVNSGLMTLRQAINVIMGANIGTTLTTWLLSLNGLGETSFLVRMLNPMAFTPILALIGILLYMVCKDSKKKDSGMILLGFSTVMFGMNIMSTAVSGLAEVPAFQQLFVLFQNPILGVIAGAVLTIIIQSSAASVGVLQALAVTGQITYTAVIPLVMGQNIGTCIHALMSAAGANKNAKRASMVHLLFNVIGSVIWIIVFVLVQKIFDPALLHEGATTFGIAIIHTAFNVTCTMILFPAAGLLEKLVVKLVPDKADTAEKVSELDERFLATPPIALQRSRLLTEDMANCSAQAMLCGLDCLTAYDESLAARVRDNEERTDHFEDILGTYLVKLSGRDISARDSAEAAGLLKVISDFERIADHGDHLLGAVEEMREKNVTFSEDAMAELHTISSAVREITMLSLTAFLKNDFAAAAQVEPLEQVIDGLKEELRTRHIHRLQNNECSIEAGFIWSDILTDMERTSDHCSNIAGCVIDIAQNNLDLHESLRAARSGSAEFARHFERFTKTYALAETK